MRYFIYILIGMGVTAGIEVSKKQDMPLPERITAIAMWPGLVAATAYIVLDSHRITPAFDHQQKGR